MRETNQNTINNTDIPLSLNASLKRKIFKETLKEYILSKESLENIINKVLEKYLISGSLPVSFIKPNDIEEKIIEEIKKLFESGSKKDKSIKEKIDELKKYDVYYKDSILLSPHIEINHFDFEKQLNENNLILTLPSLNINNLYYYGLFNYHFYLFKKQKQYDIYITKIYSNSDIEILFLYFLLKKLNLTFNLFNIYYDYYDKKFHVKEVNYTSELLNSFENILKNQLDINKNKEIDFNKYFSIEIIENENREEISVEEETIDESSMYSDDDLLSLCYEEIAFLDFKKE
jgi:hypothetical protein